MALSIPISTFKVKPFFYLAIASFFMLALEWHTMSRYRRPAGIDFSIYHRSAQAYLLDPSWLYPASTNFEQYLYPPPSVVLFMPFAALPERTGYVIFVGVMYVCLMTSLLIFFELCKRAGFYFDNKDKLLLMFFVMCSAPAYHNFLLGQINCFVLLLSLSYLYFYKDNPIVAGLFLAAAVWIKIYPGVLLFMALLTPEGRKSIVACALAGLAIPLVLLPVVPLQLYFDFLAKLNEVSHYASAHVINQSFIAFGLRTIVPFTWSVKWPNIYLIPGWLNAINYIFILLTIGFSLKYILKVSASAVTRKCEFVYGCILLAIGAVFSPLGWGHTFIFTIPILILGFKVIQEHFPDKIAFPLILIVGLLYLVPIDNTKIITSDWPSLFRHIFYSRHLWFTIMIAILILRAMSKTSSVVPAAPTRLEVGK
jgi:alpha-1,2-mannosyltransferase